MDKEVVDQIFVLKEFQAERHNYQKETYVICIDFKQADDKIQNDAADSKIYSLCSESWKKSFK